MKLLKWLGIVIFILIIVYFLGPQPASPKFTKDLPTVPAEPIALEKYISDHESTHKLKQDNEARILWWDDSLKEKTEYAVVYLHGFSASQEEGDPVHYEFAQKFGCNLYLSRLEDHGVDTTKPLANVTADRLWNSAKEAYAIGKQLGKKIILMSTSTGGTLALKLCAEYPDIIANIMLSPNIAINDGKAWMLNNHWGQQIAELVTGKDRVVKDTTALYAQYWNNRYATVSLVQLEELIESTMKESTFRKVTQPSLLLYYYRDQEHQDKVVKVSAMKRMFLQLGTPENLKRQVAIPNAGDHVMGSYVKSKDLQTVQDEIEKFAVEKINLRLVTNDR
ncbi:MAG TPA: alpha/beta hydrolase [Chitinophagaceae bacterium]|nr:alpha/beta hydrolase [Chitinophagaceae bacterium]